VTCHFIQFFLVWCVKRPLRKLAKNIFDPSVLILGLWLNLYLSSQKVRAAFFHIRGKSVFSTVQFTVTVL
jgi:hypothetical protein